MQHLHIKKRDRPYQKPQRLIKMRKHLNSSLKSSQAKLNDAWSKISFSCIPFPYLTNINALDNGSLT